ncbi:MAG: NADH-quinone oxidoreductase subunit I [Eubacteriales bacterium]|nr:NADH-quinone oxidoreductase subunit I [Eubacteriales bacterium]NCC80763.1 NADH-quinone oxidoreductase subunit I [Clostridia bacterium]
MFSFWGKGLLKGLSVTGKVIFRKNLTEEYPLVKPNIPSQWRGGFAYEKDKCIACGICVLECPNDAILLVKEKDENNKNVPKEYKINLGYCLSCGLCVESCPVNCIHFTKEFESATYLKKESVLDLFNNQNLEAERSTYGKPVEKKEEKEEGIL